MEAQTILLNKPRSILKSSYQVQIRNANTFTEALWNHSNNGLTPSTTTLNRAFNFTPTVAENKKIQNPIHPYLPPDHPLNKKEYHKRIL